MAIRFRHIKVSSTISYEQRREIEEQTGSKIGYPRIHLSNLDDEVKLSMSTGRNECLGLYYIEEDETSHEGHVVGIEVDYNVRIMSDVWADITYAVVYEPTREHTGCHSTTVVDYATMEKGPKGPCGMFRRIQIANSEFSEAISEITRAEVDADPWLLEVYETWKAAQKYAKALQSYNRSQEDIQRHRRAVERDKWVRVTRGRKVAQGTEGIVFWIGESQYGDKVGIALPREGGTFRKEKKTGRYGKVYESYADVAWTYARNVDVISGPGGRVL